MNFGITFQTLMPHARYRNYHAIHAGKVTGKISQNTWVRCGRSTVENSTVTYCTVLHGPLDAIFSCKTVYKILLHLMVERGMNMTFK